MYLLLCFLASLAIPTGSGSVVSSWVCWPSGASARCADCPWKKSIISIGVEPLRKALEPPGLDNFPKCQFKHEQLERARKAYLLKPICFAICLDTLPSQGRCVPKNRPVPQLCISVPESMVIQDQTPEFIPNTRATQTQIVPWQKKSETVSH